MSVFDRLAPFIREYIYRERWDDLRDIQVAAADVLFNTDSNLLLASGTASGKTEAAFLPVLTKLYEEPSSSVGVLYISPLKALINDQFIRLNGLLDESGIKVTKWHGNASAGEKNKLLKKPQGILQTTPESLEAMVMKRASEAIRLFSDLRYIIIDEVHAFISEDRGVQLLCLLERVQRLTGVVPIRIGLSATLGEYKNAARWLGWGTGRDCVTPVTPAPPRRLRLSVQHFFVKFDAKSNEMMDAYYDYLYASTFSKKCILFSNSKAEVEENIAHLKSIARKNHTDDVYMVHHGSISSAFRTYAEERMKSDEGRLVTGATLTLELGIDLGCLERIVQTGCPISVSSFVQRLGRSGRRGQPSEMWFVFREDIRHIGAEFYKAINWAFLKCIAVIELYIKERWVEPVRIKRLPMSVLYHQTLSFMVSAGEIAPALLAQTILTLTPFEDITQDDYKQLLRYLLEIKQLERGENGLLIGPAGEQAVNSYDFYSVFDTPQDYSVKCASEEIGTVQEAFPVGARFALAGRSWEVTELDKEGGIIYVKEIFGISTNQWNAFNGMPVHTKIMKKIREILKSEEAYPYLTDSAAARLKEMRLTAANAGICDTPIVPIANGMLAVFPFVGTRELATLGYALSHKDIFNQALDERNVPVCLFVRGADRAAVYDALKEIKNTQTDISAFHIPDTVTNGGKYDAFIPSALRIKEYSIDFLDMDGLKDGLEV